MTEYRAAVVVGVDGSASSERAVDWAAAEAARRGLPLRLVHAFIWPLLHVPLGPSAGGPQEGGLRHDAERVLAGALDRARGAAPGLRVDAALVTGAPAPVLLREAAGADLLVVGSRGLGGFGGLLLGSVGQQVSAHAPCPVVVVRGDGTPPADGPVVVGVDGSAHSGTAARVAVEAAAARGARLHAVHVLAEGADARGEGEERGRAVVDACVGPWAAKHPDVDVEPVVRRGSPARALLEAADGAQLLVVGARGRGGFAGLLLGSASQKAVQHAPCPVQVVHQPREG